jgi:methylmalonyl-CoA/ethylmalonyl-CoA epimerase
MKHLALLLAAVACVPSQAIAQSVGEPILAGGRFEQVALTVKDLAVARSFYRDRLGLRLLFSAKNMLFFDVGGVRLMIARDGTREQPKVPTNILYFHVDDFAAALLRLRADGARLVGGVETVQSNAAGTLRLQQFEDADGNMLAIMGFVAR